MKNIILLIAVPIAVLPVWQGSQTLNLIRSIYGLGVNKVEGIPIIHWISHQLCIDIDNLFGFVHF